jgi:hypothetical protein
LAAPRNDYRSFSEISRQEGPRPVRLTTCGTPDLWPYRGIDQVTEPSPSTEMGMISH